MRIERSVSIIRSEKVLRLLRKELATWDAVGEAYVNLYKNGREEGFAVLIYLPVDLNEPFKDRMVVFSQNRNSDQLVVYMGDRRTAKFGCGVNPVSEEMDQKAEYFKTEKQAAKRCSRFLKTGK